MAAITCRTVLDRVDVLSYNVRSFRLRLVEPKRLEFIPGQFVIVHIPKHLPGAPAVVAARAAQAGGSVVKRAYSVASPPHEEGVIELCIQHVDGGIASTFFWQLKVGDPLTISGPHGNFVLTEPLTYEPVFLCTGTGVAPFRSMIKHLFHVNATQEMWLFFGCRYEHSLLYEAEFRTISSLKRNFHYMPTVSRPKEWTGERGHVQQTFLKHINTFTNRHMYVCGWDVVVKAIVQDLQTAGVPNERIHYEEWA